MVEVAVPLQAHPACCSLLLLCQAEIVKRLSAICAQMVPFLTQEVSAQSLGGREGVPGLGRHQLGVRTRGLSALPMFMCALGQRSASVCLPGCHPPSFAFITLLCIYLILYVWVFCLHSCTPCVQYPQRPEKYTVSSGIGVVTACEPGVEPCSFERAARALSH